MVVMMDKMDIETGAYVDWLQGMGLMAEKIVVAGSGSGPSRIAG